MIKTLIKIWRLYKPFHKALWTMFGLIILFEALFMIGPFLQAQIIDGLVAKKSFGEISIFIGLMAVLYYSSTLIEYYKDRYELHNFNFIANHYVSIVSLGKLMEFSLGQHINENSGIKTSVITKGTDAIKNFVRMVVYNYLPAIVQIILFIIALFWLSWIVALVAIFFAVVFVWLTIRNNSYHLPQFKEVEDLFHSNQKLHTEIVRNIDVVQINSQENHVCVQYSDDRTILNEKGKNSWLSYIKRLLRASLFNDCGKIIILTIGVIFVMQGKFTVGMLIMLSSWSMTIFMKISNMQNYYRQLIENYTSIVKFFTLLEVEPDITVMDDPHRPKVYQGQIEFKNVVFGYPFRSYLADDQTVIKTHNEVNVLNDVSFTVEAGQKVAIVGESGAGKSTIATLIMRAYDPQQGQIIIDGHDLVTMDHSHLRQEIGYVEQDIKLFDNTIGYNLTFGLNGKAKKISKKDKDEAMELAGLGSFIKTLENGYNTMIGEKGIQLSGGQRQRLGIARAIIKQPNILIFDEATSSLDSNNEAIIKKAIEKVSNGKTTIIIAHRLSTIQNVDKIIMISNGKIVGQGSYHELMTSCPKFVDLIKNQLVNAE